MKKIAWFFSIVLHPLLMLNYGLFLVLYLHPFFNSRYYGEQLNNFTYFLLANTFFIPLLGILILKQFKMIDNFQISNHRQRTMPYIFIAVILCFTIYQLQKNDMRGLPIYYILSTIICLLCNIIINFKFGISSHTIASGGFIALITYIVLFQHISSFAYWLPTSIALAGISGFSRLWLEAHTTKQIYWGYTLGFIIMLSGILIFEKWNILG